MTSVRTVLVVAACAALIALLAALPLVVSGFTLRVATRGLVLVLFALAFNVVFGMGGMASLGHAAFFGVGGYAAGLGATQWGWGFAAIVVGAALAGTLLGALFGVMTLRTDGIYLLLLTLALAQAVWALAFQQVSVTGGDNGIAGISRELLPVGSSIVALYWLVLGTTSVSAAALWWFLQSPVGRVVVGLRESPSRMRAMGYRVGAYRVLAFSVSGLFCSLAGVLFAFLNRFVGPENLSWPLSAEVMVFAILGGAATFLGPAVGAALLVALESWVAVATDRWSTVLGLVYVVTILFLPDGVLGLGGRLARRVGAGRGGAEDERRRVDEVVVP